jgi:hypothetical protein
MKPSAPMLGAETAGRRRKQQKAAAPTRRCLCAPADSCLAHKMPLPAVENESVSASDGRPHGKIKMTEHRSLLVLAQPSPDTDELIEPLLNRADFCLLRVATLAAAEVALRDVAVSLTIVCPETTADQVTALLDRVSELRPGTPVLAIRACSGDPLSSWKARTVGVLQWPVVPEVLSRTVDVALGLQRGPLAASHGKGGQRLSRSRHGQ